MSRDEYVRLAALLGYQVLDSAPESSFGDLVMNAVGLRPARGCPLRVGPVQLPKAQFAPHGMAIRHGGAAFGLWLSGADEGLAALQCQAIRQAVAQCQSASHPG